MNKLYNIILLGLLLMTLTSCFQDKSTLDTDKIDGINIEVLSNNYYDDNSEAIIIPTLEVLKIKVKVTKGENSNPDVSYKWKVNPAPWLHTTLEIGEEEEIEYKVPLKINTSRPYLLSLTVTDNETGIKYFKEWKLFVSGKFSEGLVVAHTSDNTTSDMSFVSSNLFAENSVKEYIDRNIFSAVQGENMEGLITKMVYYEAERSVFGVTDTKESFRVDANDFSLFGYGKDLFSYSAIQSSNATGVYYGNTGNIYLVDNGLIYAASNANIHKFPTALHYNRTPPYYVDGPLVCYTYNYIDKARAIFYEKNSQSIKMLRSTQSPLYTTVYDLKDGVDNKESVGGGISSNEKLILILKDKSTGIYTIYSAYNGLEDPEPQNPNEVTSIDIPAGNDIENAKDFFVCDNQPVIYYSTSNAIYAINIQTGTPIVSQKYTVNSGEEITTMKVFQQAWYKANRKKGNIPIESHNKTMLVATYNSASNSGKLLAIPIINLGEGNLDKANQKEFSGFSKITAVESTGV